MRPSRIEVGMPSGISRDEASGTATAAGIDGWDRADWVDCFARLSASFARAAEAGGSPARARLPGSPPDDPIPSIEGFARMSVTWGAWLGEASNPTVVDSANGPVDILGLMVRGLQDGTDPKGRWWWGDIGHRDQRIVEAAEIATGLWLGRARLAPALGPGGVDRVLDWIARVDDKDVYDDNWVLFPAIVSAVRRAFGRVVPDAAIDGGVDAMLARYRGDGWYADGGGHAFDQYTGWAVHWHLLLWSRIEGDRRPRTRALVERRFRTYLAAVAPMFAADGSRPLFGRSLGYRFAAAAPFALAAWLGEDVVPDAVARWIMGGTIRRHLADGALDPDSGWFRRGVAGERPDVMERYVSAGASAWAAHSFVALGLPADAGFWRATEGALAVHGDDGVRPLRGPGLLFGWRRRTGETWMANARADHPDDIPGHDYTPYYGKSMIRSHFPLTVRTADGHPGPDGAVLFVGEGDADHPGAADHRGLTLAGNVGPSWAWSRYRVAVDGRTHAAVTVTLLCRDVEVRLTRVRPGGPIRLAEAPAALGVGARDDVRRAASSEWRWAAAAATDRSVAIRALIGYDVILDSAPFGHGPDRNLVADHSEQPMVTETVASSRPRVVGSVGWAGAEPTPPIPDLEAVSAIVLSDGLVEVDFGSGERAVVDVRGHPRQAMVVGRWTACGPGVRVFRAADDGSRLAGESIASIDGVVELDRPGPIALTRTADGVHAWAEGGFHLEPAWAGFAGRTVEVREIDEAWSAPTRLDEVGRVPAGLVRRLRRSTGRRLLELRVGP
jgi:hypothetical protein